MTIKWPYLISFIIFMVISFYIFYPKIENFFIFFPESSFDLMPDDLHLRYRDVYFSPEQGIQLHGWFFPLKGDLPVILFCHGNAGNISHRLDNVRRLLDQRLQVFIFDYRGYGRSKGKPSEQGIYRDGTAAYDYLIQQEHIPSDRIIVFGRSLGAAPAIQIALKKKVRSLIIESPFTCTKDMAKTMPLFFLFSPLFPTNYNNLKKIVDVKVSKLIIHGDADNVVPFSMGRKLFTAAMSPKYFYPIKGAGHNDTYIVAGREYFRTVTEFVRNSEIHIPAKSSKTYKKR